MPALPLGPFCMMQCLPTARAQLADHLRRLPWRDLCDLLLEADRSELRRLHRWFGIKDCACTLSHGLMVRSCYCWRGKSLKRLADRRDREAARALGIEKLGQLADLLRAGGGGPERFRLALALQAALERPCNCPVAGRVNCSCTPDEPDEVLPFWAQILLLRRLWPWDPGRAGRCYGEPPAPEESSLVLSRELMAEVRRQRAAAGRGIWHPNDWIQGAGELAWDWLDQPGYATAFAILFGKGTAHGSDDSDTGRAKGKAAVGVSHQSRSAKVPGPGRSG
jgi:hypothetical protein